MSALNKRVYSVFLCFGILLIASSGIWSSTAFSQGMEKIFYPELKQPALSIKLLQTKEKIAVSPHVSFMIKVFGGKEDRVYFSSRELFLETNSEGIILSDSNENRLEEKVTKVVFVPKNERFCFSLNSERYRGILEAIFIPEDTSLLVLNWLWVEDYLKGVIPFEMGKQGEAEFEALKAQALTARTYALSRIKKSESRGFDLESTVLDQIYGSMDKEESLVNKAIAETEGQVITYKGKFIQAFYHANCGGRTESVKEVWGHNRIAYLASVSDKDYCSWYKRYEWRVAWEREKLEKNLPQYLKEHTKYAPDNVGKIKDMKIKKRSKSGRVKELEIKTNKGRFHLKKDKIRWVIRKAENPEAILPSTLFALELIKNEVGDIDSIIFEGRGNGHGVGMCQTGAIGMARKGHTYRQILQHYYPDTEIKKVY
ncbi:MAG: SpoIID/LytB domain-containing protein [Candidatus Zixiibacteriota bacterium]